MGQTLSSAAQWTSAKDTGRGRLEFTPVNEVILNKIIQFVEGFSSKHAEESRLVFKQPVTWTTELTQNDLSSGFSQKGDEFCSNAVNKAGQPAVVMKRKGTKSEISVTTFEELENVLRISGQKKMAETCFCLEANPDPLAKMLGDRFATISGSDGSAYRFIEEIMRSQPAGGGAKSEGQDQGHEVEENEEKKVTLKFLLLMKDFDDKLLQEAIKAISSDFKISPPDVDRAFDLLKRFCGDKDENHVLKDIAWTEPHTFVFNNGCRAPFWRQLKGDISYITAWPHDAEPISITASTHGYYINGGFNDATKSLEFEKSGELCRDLVVLLREKSPHFAQAIEQQEVFKMTDSSNNNSGGMTSDLYATQENDETDAQGSSRALRHAGNDQSNNNKKHDQQKKLEPSLKWKIVEVEEKDKDKKENTIVQFKTKETKKRKELTKLGHQSDGDSSFEESSSESEDEEETPDRRPEGTSDLPSEYWQIQKLVKYLKGGNQTATIIALCSIRDFNLSQETCQLAIRDVGGLDVLINLLDTDEPKCKIGALKILKEISRNPQIRRAIADLGGLQTMVKILRDPNKELKCLSAETIANVAKFRRARRTVRQHGGIKNLVALLDVSSRQKADIEVARSGALALWSLSKSLRNKVAMRKAGVIPLLAKLLKSSNIPEILVPVVGTLQECATEASYRLAIRTEGMIGDLVRHLKSNNVELQMHCASAIFKCAEEKETRDLIRQNGGLDPLVALISKTDNKDLLAAATGAIWKCAISPKNVVRFQELKAIELLVGLLNDQPEEVLVNVVGALAELAKDTPNRMTIRKANGIPPLVNLLTGTNQALLVNVTKAVGQCAEEPDNMVVIDKLDGVRLLWSLLKNQNQDVQASAALALCPCIKNAKDAGEMVRSFVGGLELIVSLLKSDNVEVLASVCAAVAMIANDEENLAVITDHGVVPMLARLTNTDNDRLRLHLAEAIARCCNWGTNRVAFGNEDAVRPLVKYLKSPDPAVHRSTARALHQLSKDPDNCIAMHDVGVVKPLMELVGSDDTDLQEAAAGCLSNIRRLALANEKARRP